MINYFYDCYQILNKVYSDKAFVKQAINDTFIEEKNRALTVKTVYGVLEKDIELSYYIKSLTEKTPKLAIRTILKISMYAIKYLNKKVYAVTENAVELTKKLGKKGASGFVNAFLRKFISATIPMPKDEVECLSVKYSYPLFALKELINDYGLERAEKIISADNPKTCLAFYDTDGEKYLKDRNYKFEKTPFDNVYLVDNFIRDDGYDKGLYTYQALGSIAICDSVSPVQNLLDCCSAPGGKSVRLSYSCESVTATELHPHRVELVKSYASRMGRNNITALCLDASVFNPDFSEKFDAVLCDAPCSGLGVVNDNPDIKLNREENSINELTELQLKILVNVSKYVKKDGYLYYSTCSVLKRENIEIIKKFIQKNNNFAVEYVNSPLPHENIENTLAFLPDVSGGLGFYFAKLKRIK